MSIIERAAKLLGPTEQLDLKSSASGEKGGVRADLVERAFSEGDELFGISEAGALVSQLDAIERAVNEGAERSGLIEPGEFTVRAESLSTDSKTRVKPASPDSRTARVVRINRDQLRRQQMITPDGERTPIAESFRRVKRRILANMTNPGNDAPASLVLVTSALAGEGKTFCAINLAISIALEIDHTVLLVDADVAKPCIPRVLGLKGERGLMDVLVDRRIELDEVLLNTDIGKLTILPAGTAHQHATELLASDAMRTLLHELAERYQDRIVVFDSPPLLAASEASALASQMGQIVMVVEAGKTSEAALKAALGRIEPNTVTGLLLNKGRGPGPGYAYGGYG